MIPEKITLAIVFLIAGWMFCEMFLRLKRSLTITKPLFKTHDGVQMGIGDRYWYVGYCVDEKVVQVCTVLIRSEKDCAKGFAQFSSRELAQQHFDYYFEDLCQKKR